MRLRRHIDWPNFVDIVLEDAEDEPSIGPNMGTKGFEFHDAAMHEISDERIHEHIDLAFSNIIARQEQMFARLEQRLDRIERALNL